MREKLLEVRNVRKSFGGIVALDDFSMHMYRGEFLGIIGPNGAGKTTLLNIISGIIKPDAGKVIFEGKNITNYPPYKISKLGIALTIQHTSLFENLTLEENIAVSFLSRNSWHLKVEDKNLTENIIRIADRLGIKSYLKFKVKNLPFGVKKLSEFALALMTKPKLVLLDEPAAGLSREDMIHISEIIMKLKGSISTIIVDHNVEFVLKLVDRVIVLNKGRKIADGKPSEIINNKKVQEIYGLI